MTTVYDNPSLTLLTEEKILRADPTDFTNIPGECDELLWSVVPEHIGHGYSSGSLCVYNGMKSEVMAANGYITVRQTQNKGRRYAYTLFPPVIYEPTVISDYNVSLMWSDLGDDRSAVYLYDALNHKMLFYNGSQLVHPEKEVNSRAPFDLWDLSAYEPFLSVGLPIMKLLYWQKKSQREHTRLWRCHLLIGRKILLQKQSMISAMGQI